LKLKQIEKRFKPLALVLKVHRTRIKVAGSGDWEFPFSEQLFIRANRFAAELERNNKIIEYLDNIEAFEQIVANMQPDKEGNQEILQQYKDQTIIASTNLKMLMEAQNGKK